MNGQNKVALNIPPAPFRESEIWKFKSEKNEVNKLSIKPFLSKKNIFGTLNLPVIIWSKNLLLQTNFKL